MKKILYIMCCLIITFMITGCNNARTFEEDNLGSGEVDVTFSLIE